MATGRSDLEISFKPLLESGVWPPSPTSHGEACRATVHCDTWSSLPSDSVMTPAGPYTGTFLHVISAWTQEEELKRRRKIMETELPRLSRAAAASCQPPLILCLLSLCIVSFTSSLAALPRLCRVPSPCSPHSYQPSTEDPRPMCSPSLPWDKLNLAQVRAPRAQGQSSYLDLHPGRAPGEKLACCQTITSQHLGPSLWAQNSGECDGEK